MHSVLSSPFVATVFFAFWLWMFLDATQRRLGPPWLLLLVFFPPSAVVYFFAVKARGPGPTRVGEAGGSPAEGLVEFRRRAEEAATPDAWLELADALEASERSEEALPVFERVLSETPDEPRALHGLARCYLGLDKARLAVETLEKVLEQEPRFRDYSAALDYAEALWRAGDRAETVELLRGMVEETGRPNHRLALAHYARLVEATELAREQLHRLLSDYERSDAEGRRRASRWVSRAQEMLAELDERATWLN